MRKAVKKQQMEQETITYMIHYYCKKKHKEKELCTSCTTLLNYAKKRIAMCPFMESKTFCSACKVHCYNTEMRQRIREVMRFSGPRMLLHRPIMALRHICAERKEKRL